MLDRVEEILTPDDWKSVDLVKQTKDVMVLVQQLYCTSTCTACICFLYLFVLSADHMHCHQDLDSEVGTVRLFLCELKQSSRVCSTCTCSNNIVVHWWFTGVSPLQNH